MEWESLDRVVTVRQSASTVTAFGLATAAGPDATDRDSNAHHPNPAVPTAARTAYGVQFMSIPFWDEYARVQRQVEMGTARDEQLDALLKRHSDGHPFDLYDCRRRLKNLDRNVGCCRS